MKKVLYWLLIAICPMLTVSCSDKESDEPQLPTLEVADNIIGTWLLSTSDAENWISYEITKNAHINAEIARSGYYGTGTGYYSIENENITGSYKTDRGEMYYVNWVVSAIKPFEIDIKIYDETVFVGDASIYRVVGNVEVEAGSTISPDYRGFCGTNSLSDFKMLDSSIAEISNTGVVTALTEGVTFATFTTPNGIAAIRIIVNEKIKTFAELIAGTWIYDNTVTKVWERYTFTEDGYVYVEWQTDDALNLRESAQGEYSITDQTVSFKANSSSGQMNMRMVTESISDLNWTYTCYNGSSLSGTYSTQRLLESVNLSPQGTAHPDYQTLVGTSEIKSYKSHNSVVASVSETGEIIANSKGRTYIDVETDKGTGVVEVNVEAGAIPVAFQECIGKGVSKIHELLGDNPSYEDATTAVYYDYTPDIEMIGFQLEAVTGFVRGVTIKYKSTVNTSQVTSILEATFIPFIKGTTDTYKAYMDAAELADATVGVTWDIPKLTLTYVNLFQDLFTNYSVLIGLDRQQAINRMGRQPDTTTNDAQAWLVSDNKGVKFVLASYSSHSIVYDEVHSVSISLDDKLTVEQVTNYLKRKYAYYPEYSSNDELVFAPEDRSLMIYYQPKEKKVMYFDSSDYVSESRADVDQLKMRTKSIKR